jgi:hypothetical protein
MKKFKDSISHKYVNLLHHSGTQTLKGEISMHLITIYFLTVFSETHDGKKLSSTLNLSIWDE